ncbi:hypothetical protein BJV82DRAFT_601174 [Fennellomyces sp. T-0311]|nr:hypothetical protein BJV82DRAFT_601174 [Fennellomyces sp. T-0311]
MSSPIFFKLLKQTYQAAIERIHPSSSAIVSFETTQACILVYIAGVIILERTMTGIPFLDDSRIVYRLTLGTPSPLRRLLAPFSACGSLLFLYPICGMLLARIFYHSKVKINHLSFQSLQNCIGVVNQRSAASSL